MKASLIGLFMLVSVSIGLPALAAEPGIHEVYQAAEAGRLDEAQRMMTDVLKAHPNSAKAHYVEADLLAKQGQMKQAAAELATAEKLEPGLPFANAQAVAGLKQTIGGHPTSKPAASPAPSNLATHNAGFPWGMLVMGAGVAALLVWVIRLLTRRNSQPVLEPSPAGYGYRAANPPYPYPGPAQPAPGTSPGLGSQVLGGLATGAAVGAGIVAGEALMHHLMDGSKDVPSPDRALSGVDSIPSLSDALPDKDDMGGTDFGISDASSWDDSGGGDSDWN